MHQNLSGGRAPPGPFGELTALSPHPLIVLRGRDAGRKKRGNGGEEGKGKGRGREEGREEKGVN